MLDTDKLISSMLVTMITVSLYDRPSILLVADAYTFDKDFVHFYQENTRVASIREVDIQSIFVN